MIVAMASAAYTMVTVEFAALYCDRDIGADPTRIVQGWVGGIGFLGRAPSSDHAPATICKALQQVP